ncbi:MAG: hypothetical protein AAGK97_01535 [Bacteroidota bacterium]
MNTLFKIFAIVLTVGFLSSCTKDAQDDCICPEIYQPVFDRSGNQYDNACLAECAGVEYFENSPETKATIWRNATLPAGCQWLVRIKDQDFIATNLDKDIYADNKVITISYKEVVDTANDFCESPNGLIEIVTLRIDE